MRTTVDLADDVAAEVSRLRREKGLGLSEAVNELARAGLGRSKATYTYEPNVYPMTARIDLSNVADVLELLDETEDEPADGDRRAG
jgi:hypothetical protein